MDVIVELTSLIGADAVLTDPADLDAVTEDWRGRYRGPALCLARPANTGQVADVVRCCAKHGVPVLPQGGNTSLCGGAVPSETGPAPVILSLTRMRAVRAIDPVNNTMEVEAGCVLATVQEAAAAAGRLYPVSLGAEGSCQIGGTIATNAGGTSVLRYGNTRENVLGLEVVLADGTVWSGLYGLRKNNTGYDLKHLFIGSEGTLGIITAATLKLHPLPTRHAVAWVGMASPEDALTLLTRVQARSAARLSAFEMINRLQLDLVVGHVPGRRSPIESAADWHVLIELSDNGSGEALDDELQAILEDAFADGLLSDAALASSEAQRHAMWEIRHSVSEANKKAGVGLTTDCAVPLSAVPAFIASATAAVRALVPDLPVIVVAHLGDGNVHFIPFFSFDAWEEAAAAGDRDALAAALRHAVNDEAARLKGTFSAEHGIGRVQLAEMARYKPSAELTLMRAVKRALDPQNIFNPGRLLPPG
ncbi:FAD/FMN-containing dehydrogenase [Azospirillum brasilense]|uniref:FAD/FMN-containing dehydrogenase n=1 Tax=Azospirillum brasilense TaxID=192 RepID=A0A560ASV5_AZOBR|nr:FAD-binding oxidoreductase [Azospirillum brasilense]TWA63440.1 FAD/FMN-containing dehydrogenase [Azospirillum brasilense]